jgi:glutamate-5-semialdehyde dehydrogenase
MTTFDIVAASQAARHASRVIGAASTDTKNKALLAMAEGLETQTDAICDENKKDMDGGRERALSPALLDRLLLTPDRISGMASMLREVVALPDPIGELSEEDVRPNGLKIARMRIPIGVIAMIYESRPNVTTDAAALCLKSGNVAILKGGSEAIHSNRILATICSDALESVGLPRAGVTLVDTTDRGAVLELLHQEDNVDLVIPRGGEGLIRFVTRESRIPVVQHYKGVCHLFVDKEADQERAVSICVNAKAQRPGVCNAMETLLIDQSIATEFLTQLSPALQEAGVDVRGDASVCQILENATRATDEDWDTEYLDLVLSIRIVKGIEEAISHIERYGSGHTDGILTRNENHAQNFINRVHSSAVMVNASTRFNDGNQLGLGAEIGISTSRLHAYGPMGLRELTIRKFVVMGDGHIRE